MSEKRPIRISTTKKDEDLRDPSGRRYIAVNDPLLKHVDPSKMGVLQSYAQGKGISEFKRRFPYKRTDDTAEMEFRDQLRADLDRSLSFPEVPLDAYEGADNISEIITRLRLRGELAHEPGKIRKLHEGIAATAMQELNGMSMNNEILDVTPVSQRRVIQITDYTDQERYIS